MKISDTASQYPLKFLSQLMKEPLSPGDRFSGRILAMENGLLLLQLTDGSKISAQVKSDAAYAAGDTIYLEVIEQSNNQLIVRDLQDGQAADGRELLKSMELPTDSLRLEIVKEALNMGFEPQAEAVEKVVALIEANKVTEPKQAVFLVMNGMENREEFYPLLQKLDEASFHFHDKWGHLLELIEESDESVVMRIAQKLAEPGQLPQTIQEAKDILSKTRISNKEFIESDESGLPKLNEWIRETERKLAIINESATHSGEIEKTGILAAVRELQTALQFFNETTSYEAFAQIPIMLAQQTTQGELFVMKRKGSRGKLKPEDFSLFLSLTTKNLGVMDAFVHVQSRNVMIRVMVEDERFYSLVSDEYKHLYQALKQKGFNLYELKTNLRDEGIDLFNAVKKASEFTEKNKKIDIKV